MRLREQMTGDKRALPQHFQDFLDWIDIEKGLSEKTQENYGRFLKKFFDWLISKKLESLKPHELTPEHIWNYKVYLSRKCRSSTNQPLKKSTQNYYLIALRVFLNYFAHRNITALATEKVSLARDKDDHEVRFLVMDQLEKLFAAPNISEKQGLRDRAILESFFSTGMRISELISLNRNQIKISSGTDNFELSISGKGGRIRTVYFSPRALLWLRKYLNSRIDMDEALFVNFQKHNTGARLTPRAIEKSFKRYVIMAGLPLNTTPHVMRHSFATDLLRQGVDLRVIQDFLGHKNIAATQIYAHVTSKQLRDIHRKLHSGGQ